MKTSESITTISKAIFAAKSQVGKIPKNGYNSFDKYKYARLEDYIDALKPVLDEHKLTVITSSIGDNQPVDRVTSKGNNENGVFLKLEMTVMHESGEWIAIESWGEGQDRADKSSYKATTGGRKYGLAMLFDLVTEDDPEGDENVGVGSNGGMPSAPQAKSKPNEL